MMSCSSWFPGSKYLGGHSDLLCGVLVVKSADECREVRRYSWVSVQKSDEHSISSIISCGVTVPTLVT